ncbi:MAG TPA: rhomboid family intramembrane serine protease, partial [Polyangia bacterium]
QTWIADALLRPADTAPLCLLLVFGSVVGYQLWYRWREAAALHRLDSLAGLCRPSLLRRLVGSTAFWLVALCATGALLPAAAATRLAVQPDALGAGRGLWTLVTASFVHASLTHVLIVGILLGYLASALELHLGRAGLFAVFVGGGAAGSVAHVAFGGAAPLFGAMSGVAAMGGCLVALAPRRETRVAIPGGGAVALPAIIGIPLSLGLYGLIIAMGAFDLPCTPWLAQAVGFAAGVIVGLLVRAHRSLAALAVRPVRA